jgi:hypothetical protein
MDNDNAFTGRAVGGGVVAGVAGGLLLALFLVGIAAGHHADVWQTLKGAGAPFLHDRAMRPGFDGLAVLVGVVSHFAVSIVWGVLFGLLALGLERGATVGLGAGWGFVCWFGMAFVVLPMVGLGEVANHLQTFGAVVEHVIYGVVLGLAFLPFQITRPTPRTTIPASAAT